jgi:hypothetical protein
VFSKQLHVRDEFLGGVARQIDVGLAGVWRAPPAAALIEQHDAIRAWIEQPAVPDGRSRTRTSVDHDGRFPTRVAARLPADAVAVTDLQYPLVVRLDRRIQAPRLVC